MSNLTDTVARAALAGIAVNVGQLRDDELCREAMRDAAAGRVEVKIDTNRYGFVVRPLSNLINGGSAISEAFKTREEAVAWAREYVAAAPNRRRFVKVVVNGRDCEIVDE